MNEILAPYPIIVHQLVDWGDMDAYQHVNNTVFFRHFENARIAYFARIAWLDIEGGKRVGPILASTACRYRRPVTYPDTLQSATRVTELQDSGFVMHHLIWSEKLQAVAAQGESRIVSYDYGKQEKCLLPDHLRDAIRSLEKEFPQ